MSEGTECKAEDKLEEVDKRDFVENLENYDKDEFLRKQLIDEANVAIIDLNNVLHQIKNNFDAFAPSDYSRAELSLQNFKSILTHILDDVSVETSL